MERFLRTLPVLVFVILLPLSSRAGSPIPERLVLTDDPLLRNGLATAHLVRGEVVDVMATLPPASGSTANDHLNAGLALKETGRFIQSSKEFQRAILASEPFGETWLVAYEQILKMSEHYPGLDLPPVNSGEKEKFPPDLVLYLAGYLADQGDRKGALEILVNSDFKDPRHKILSGVLEAGHTAVLDSWDDSARVMGKIYENGNTSFEDLFHLLKGYHFLQSAHPDQARESFSSILPGSPYLPDAMLGKAWSLIKANDTQDAAIVLEELIEHHGSSKAAEDGVLDLAIVYRDLGLHDRAGEVLERHLMRLREERNWLAGLSVKELETGSDIATLLESALHGIKPHSELLLRTPPFIRQWVSEVASDRYIKHTTALLKGLEFTAKKLAKLGKRLEYDRQLVSSEIDQVERDISHIIKIRTSLEMMHKRFASIKDDMTSTLQTRSLSGFASERARMLISKIGELKIRLSLMESSVQKARGFTSLIGKLSESVTVSSEETQLNQIRERAYEGLISSRMTLRNLRESLISLEGRLWLEVKGGAIDLERQTSLRVISGRTRSEQALAEVSRINRSLIERKKGLGELELLIVKSMVDLGGPIADRVEDLKNRIGHNRAVRMVDLAAASAIKIREAEARTLYTYADIEISRMNSTIRSIQEAVQ